MRLLYVGTTPPSAPLLARRLGVEELVVVPCADLRQAIVENRFQPRRYGCVLLEDLMVLEHQAELLSIFLSVPGHLPVVICEPASGPGSSILLVSEIEVRARQLLVLVRRVTRFSSVSSSHYRDMGEYVILEYQAPCPV